MILIQYTDDNGFMCQAYVKRENDNPIQGIAYNPPNLDTLGLNIGKQRELNNALIHSGLITFQDVLESNGAATGTLRRLNLFHLRRQLITLYKIEK